MILENSSLPLLVLYEWIFLEVVSQNNKMKTKVKYSHTLCAQIKSFRVLLNFVHSLFLIIGPGATLYVQKGFWSTSD